MEQLHFTTKVLGPLAAYRLVRHQVTQTIRGRNNSIVQPFLPGQLKVGDRMAVILDERPIGLAEYIFMDEVNWECLNLDDARRGGFDTLDDLGQALKRAGYHFLPLHNYRLYRLQFSWLEEHIESSKEKIINLLSKSEATYEEIGKRVGVSRQWVHQVAKEVGLTRNRQPHHYRSDITVDRVLELYHQDLLVNDIAQTLNCELSTVRRRLREAGISKSECQSRSMRLAWRGDTHYRDDVTVEGVLKLYRSNLFIKDIARTLDCNQATVRKRLRLAGIRSSENFSRAAKLR
ncbi:hypothetical protein ES703_67972 [subsurface metagenome]